MSSQTFRYGDIKKLMSTVVHKLEEEGYLEEAAAMASLTHIIGSRVEPPNVSSKWGTEYMLECIDHHNSLIKYINDGAIYNNSEM